MHGRTVLDAEQDSLTTDVVIVGAGPAGCGAAFDLASNGIRVLLLDRTEFPRRKTCAGGLTVKTVRTLGYSIAPVIQKTVCNLSVSYRMRQQRLLRSLDPICHMVERSAFDHFCLKKTIAAGACFAVVKRIDKIVENDRCVSLQTDCGLIRGRYLIGADGVHSRVRQLTGRFAHLRTGFAVEGIVDRAPPANLDMGFDFSLIKGGYGWVFPKAGHINVGLYALSSDIKITRKDLNDYVARRFGGALPTRVSAYPLGMGGWRYQDYRGRVLLTGDAAGLVDPLLGEGVYHAIVSGQLAAVAILDALENGSDAANAYAKKRKPIQRDLIFSRRAATVFYKLPRIGHLVLTSPIARVPLMNGFSQGMSLLDICRYGHRFWFNMPMHSSITTQN